MWTRIGLATARRQLRVGGVPLIGCVAAPRPAVVYSGAILRRAFSGSRIRALAAASEAKKTTTKTTARKATKTAAKPKSAAKAKAKKPKKAAAKKVVPKKKKVKKVLTEEEKRRIQISELKKIGLVGAEPKTKPATPRAVYISEIQDWTQENFTKRLKTFKDVSASELERFTSIAEANKVDNAAALKAFIQARTPAEIQEVNKARRFLHRLKKYTRRRLPLLDDERCPKRPIPPFLLFAKQYVKGSAIPQESIKEAAAKWSALSASERQTYKDNYLVDATRFIQEYKAVFGQEPISFKQQRDI